MLRTAPPKLSQIQDPISARLDRVVDEFRRIVAGDFDRIAEINDYLLQVRGKLFRPDVLRQADERAARQEAPAEPAQEAFLVLSGECRLQPVRDPDDRRPLRGARRDRPGREDLDGLHDPGLSLERLSDPPAAQDPDLLGSGRILRLRSHP